MYWDFYVRLYVCPLCVRARLCSTRRGSPRAPYLERCCVRSNTVECHNVIKIIETRVRERCLAQRSVREGFTFDFCCFLFRTIVKVFETERRVSVPSGCTIRSFPGYDSRVASFCRRLVVRHFRWRNVRRQLAAQLTHNRTATPRFASLLRLIGRMKLQRVSGARKKRRKKKMRKRV